jgi:hypothetical protein
MNRKMFSMVSALIGAGLMFFLDPDRGKRRRALTRDKLVSWGNTAAERINGKARDLRNRAQGVAANVRHLFSSDGAGDGLLAQRVRSIVDETVSNPSAIETRVEGGRVILQGDIPDSELPALLESLRSISSEVDNRLRSHTSAVQALSPEREAPRNAAM